MDRSPPILTTLGRPSEVIRLRDGRWAVSITSKHLRAIDAHSPPDGLQFAIVTPPGFGHLENIHTGKMAAAISTLVARHIGHQVPKTYRFKLNPSR